MSSVFEFTPDYVTHNVRAFSDVFRSSGEFKSCIERIACLMGSDRSVAVMRHFTALRYLDTYFTEKQDGGSLKVADGGSRKLFLRQYYDAHEQDVYSCYVSFEGAHGVKRNLGISAKYALSVSGLSAYRDYDCATTISSLASTSLYSFLLECGCVAHDAILTDCNGIGLVVQRDHVVKFAQHNNTSMQHNNTSMQHNNTSMQHNNTSMQHDGVFVKNDDVSMKVRLGAVLQDAELVMLHPDQLMKGLKNKDLVFLLVLFEKQYSDRGASHLDQSRLHAVRLQVCAHITDKSMIETVSAFVRAIVAYATALNDAR